MSSLDFNDIQDGSEAVECVARTTITNQVGAHFGPVRQGPGKDPGEVPQLVEQMEVREG